MRAVGIFVCALALIGAAAASSNARELLANDRLPKDSSSLPECPPNLPVTETGVPGLKPMIDVRTRPSGISTRNFNCFGGVPKTYSEYSAELNQVEQLWKGDLYYDVNGFPTFALTFQDPYQDYIRTNRTVVTFKEFVEVPSPTPGAAPWARYKVMSDTGNPPFSYVERTNTGGGAMPSSCKGGADIAKVSYNATYNFYMCNEAPAVPVAPIMPAVPDLPSPSPSPDIVPTAEPPVPAVAEEPIPAIAEEPIPDATPSTPVIAITFPSPTATPLSPTVEVAASGSYTIKAAMSAFVATVLFAMLA
ncbi:hypothetical protein Ndes2526B_g08553 [Nannochloris sp. 'desiccata']|nr:hypothetical protein KSW81_001851 [Chlorella desiccata (nom. nud.)]KAH7616460.1 hypothetical protein NADE_001279 [Chlorella desiccata (nom. nud.)]